MNRTILSGKWKQFRGKSKLRLAKVTDNDRQRIVGRLEILAGIIQEKYGITRQHAARKFSRRRMGYQARLKKVLPGRISR